MTWNLARFACLSWPVLAAGCPTDDPMGDDGGTPGTTTGIPMSSDSSSDDGPGATSVSPGTTTGMPATDSSGGAESTSTGVVDPTDGVIPGTCGNNVIEGDEVCDLNQLNGETCMSLGYQGGTLGCLLDCSDYSLFGCFICGNGVIDQAEDCEGVVPEGTDCESMGFEGGTLACGGDCLWDTSDCSICGDGVQQGLEQCDGIDYGGETCMSIGFDMGTLGCNLATCTFDVGSCEGGQYFQDFEAGAFGPEWSFAGNQDWVVDSMAPIAGMFSAHSGPITHNQTSNLIIDANFAGPGSITFSHKESSEGSFDYLEFWVDGVMIQEWSGINPVAMFMHPVAAGMHNIQWRYTKDGSVNTGSDRVWIDDVSFIPGVPI